MGFLARHLALLYAKTPFTQRLKFSGVVTYGYFDQEETLQADQSGDQLLVKRTVFRIRTPATTEPMASIAADSAVTVFDPETGKSISYYVSDKELIGDGKETRLILRAA